MLKYSLRVRDLVHGTILFTETEERIINHPFFQRLRHVRQNDVAFYVYPSLNTSRFEHLLGTCRVAGMMAESLTNSPKWELYAQALSQTTGIALKDEFVQLCRLYALLHDIGHLPLSHLFEIATTEYAKKTFAATIREFIHEWTGVHGFEKLHEAFGAALIHPLAEDVVLPEPLSNALIELMTVKRFPSNHPLIIVKKLIDSPIDADRIDATKRDGLLAGGEYGNYDIRRLCDAVFIEQYVGNWLIAYSEKALTSMEAILFDRYRTHVWVHFHHRVVTMKTLVSFLIGKALGQGMITGAYFNPATVYDFALRDDVWLWNVLRGMPTDDETTQMIKRAVFYREKQHVLNLWKGRIAYHEITRQAKDQANVSVFDYGFPEVYIHELIMGLDVQSVLLFKPPFEPISEELIRLYSEQQSILTGQHLLEVSKLVATLDALWEEEPREFTILIGENVRARESELKEQWVNIAARCIRMR